MTREPARFEYRVWSPGLEGVIDALRAASRRVDVLAGRETYLVSAATVEVNPKVREGVLDTKVLVAEEDGFEQWDVHSKRTFPLEGEMVGELLTLLDTPATDLPRGTFDLGRLLEEVVEPHHDLFAIDVTKNRELYTVGACRAEVTVATIGGTRHQTVAIESVDLSELATIRASFGLDGYPNVSYPRFILETMESNGN